MKIGLLKHKEICEILTINEIDWIKFAAKSMIFEAVAQRMSAPLQVAYYIAV